MKISQENNSRLPQFELLRIIAMLLIVTLHFLSHGGVNDELDFGTFNYFFFSIIRAIAYLGVNCFVLISGYFLCNSSFKPSRIVKVTMQVLFYSMVCTFVVAVFFHTKLSIKDYIFTVFPISSNKYWFASEYIVLLFIYPVLNHAISSMNRKKHFITVIIMLFIFSLIPTVLLWSKGLYSDGKDIGWFITLYLIASYLRRYPARINKKIILVMFCLSIISTVFIEYVISELCYYYSFDVPEKIVYYNNSPFIVLGAVLLLIWVSNLKHIPFENKVINIANLTFGVYLLHDNDLLRLKLWQVVNAPRFINNLPKELLFLVGTVITIFCVGCIVEYTRKSLVKIFHIEEKIGNYSNSIYMKLYEKVENSTFL